MPKRVGTLQSRFHHFRMFVVQRTCCLFIYRLKESLTGNYHRNDSSLGDVVYTRKNAMSLNVLNYTAGGMQLVLCAFLLVWLVLLMQEGDTSITFNVEEYNGIRDGLTHGQVPLTVVVSMLIAFTLITGLVHIFAYARAGPSYRTDVRMGNNWRRWIEYAATATIMIIVIALCSGTGSIDTLILLAASTICCMFCGLMSESTARSNTYVSMLATGVGWILMIGAFSVILRRFGSIFQQASETVDGDGIPWYVWGIIISMTILYMVFGLIHLVHMRRQWADANVPEAFHLRIEKLYTIASMVSKVLLVVFLASGLFARDQTTD